MSTTTCTHAACLNAVGGDCVCPCGGSHHGQAHRERMDGVRARAAGVQAGRRGFFGVPTATEDEFWGAPRVVTAAPVDALDLFDSLA